MICSVYCDSTFVLVTQQMSMNFDSILKQKTKKKKERRDIIVEVKLGPPTRDNCTIVDFPQLVREQLGHELSDGENEDNEEHRKLKEIAKKLEDKYQKNNPTGKKKKIFCADDYMDLGMGYDKSDSFIDDSEAYDELIPSTLDTKYGGFYVNRGVLEYVSKTASDGDSESGSESGADEDEQPKVSKPEKSAKETTNGVVKERKKKRKQKSPIDATIESIATSSKDKPNCPKSDGTKSVKSTVSGKKPIVAAAAAQDVKIASTDTQVKSAAVASVSSTAPTTSTAKSFALPKPRLSACPPSSAMMRKAMVKTDKKRKSMDLSTGGTGTAPIVTEVQKFKRMVKPPPPIPIDNSRVITEAQSSPAPYIQTPTSTTSSPLVNGKSERHLEDVISSVIQGCSAPVNKISEYSSFDIDVIENNMRRSS